jgi:hypothetical protein
MSGAELRAYMMSPGAVLNEASDGDVEERAAVVVDKARAEHLRLFGHLPGSEHCTLPGRDDAVSSAVVSLRAAAQRSVIPWGLPTAEAQAQIRRLMPYWYIPDPLADAETERARRDLAVKLAGGLVA